MEDSENIILQLKNERDELRRRVAELASLAQSLARFDLIFSSIKDALIVADTRRRIVAVNPAVTKLWGYASEELIGKTMEFLYADKGDYEEQGRKGYQEDVDKEHISHEVQYKRKDGSVFWGESVGAQVTDPEGNVLGFVALHRDITDRRKAEEELRTSEARYREIFNASNDAIFIHDMVTGYLLDVNQKACEMFKLSREDMVKSMAWYMSSGESPYSEDDAVTWIHKAIVEGPQTFEWLSKNSEGTLFGSEVNLKRCVIQGKDSILATVRGISARDKTENALRASEERYRSLVDNALVGIYQTTKEGRILNVNQAMLDLFEYKTKEEMTSKYAQTVYKNPEDRAKFLSALEKEGRVSGMEMEFVTSTGKTRYGILSGALEGDVISGMISDITERRKAEEELTFLLRQQEVTAELGMLSVTNIELPELFRKATSLVARVLNVEFCKILELLPDNRNMLLTARFGWPEELVERIPVGTGRDSQESFTLLADRPVIVDNLITETRFPVTPLLRDQKIISGMSVKIQGGPIPFGVLCAHTKVYRRFTEKEAHFLQSVANILSQAVERHKVEKTLRESERKYRSIIEDTGTGFAIVSEDGTVLDANAEYIKLSGHISLDQIVGRKAMEWTTAYDRERYAEELRKCGERGFIRGLDIDFVDKSGNIVPVEIAGTVMETEQGKRYALLVRDISEHRRLQEQLKSSAITDYLTGLLNRRGFFTLAEQQCKLADRTGQRMSLLFIDLDNMKQINDTLGHKEGDRALIDTASLLRKTFREADIVARIGGDEFAVLLTAHSEPDIEQTVSGHIQHNLNVHNTQSGRPFLLSFSMGFAHYDPEHPCSVGDLLTSADIRMYEVKKQHKHEQDVEMAKARQEKEKRRQERALVSGAWFAEILGLGKARIKNISPGGVYMRTVQKIQTGRRCEILIHPPDKKDLWHEGIVVWSRKAEPDKKTVSNEYCCEAGIKFIG
jgi:diguanylate cyclase (GGDEF)-like protein/PAS domain S-box-containing protein